jgi:hypothetical protein
LSEVIKNIDFIPIKITNTAKINIKQFNTMIKFLKSQIKNLTPAEVIKTILNTIKYEQYLKESE